MRDNSTEHKTRRAASSKDVRPAELDEVDRRILSLLHGDARMPNNALADTVGIAPSTCHGRVRRLVDLGVIRGFYTDIDPVAVGLPLQAMISVNLQSSARGKIRSFIQQIRRSAVARSTLSMYGPALFRFHAGNMASSLPNTAVGLRRAPGTGGPAGSAQLPGWPPASRIGRA